MQVLISSLFYTFNKIVLILLDGVKIVYVMFSVGHGSLENFILCCPPYCSFFIYQSVNFL